jgi:hypothetical protein
MKLTLVVRRQPDGTFAAWSPFGRPASGTGRTEAEALAAARKNILERLAARIERSDCAVRQVDLVAFEPPPEVEQGYYWGPKEDGGVWIGPFETRERAEADGRGQAADYGAPNCFWTARGVTARPQLLGRGPLLLEALGEEMADGMPGSGPWETWPGGATEGGRLTDDELRLLDGHLAAALSLWLDETGRWPGWTELVDVRRHEAAPGVEGGAAI